MTYTTTPDVQSDAGSTNDEGNWQARYQGLQKVLSTRDAELAAEKLRADEALAALDAQSADMTELQEHRQAKAAAEAERQEREQFAALKAKFEEAPPTPLRHANEHTRVWSGPDYPEAEARKRDAEVGGFPV